MKQTIEFNIPVDKEIDYEKSILEGNTISIILKDKSTDLYTIYKKLNYRCISHNFDNTHLTTYSNIELKLRAIQDIIVVAKYLNDKWEPNWNDFTEHKYSYIIDKVVNKIKISRTNFSNETFAYFKNKELAEQAIDILGEEVIRLALSTNY